MSNKQVQSPHLKLVNDETAAVLAEIEDVIRTMPSQAILRLGHLPEAFSWFGRAAAAVARSDEAAGVRARRCMVGCKAQSIQRASELTLA
jgi:hypothetical protein